MAVARDLAAPPLPVALGTALLPYLFLGVGCLAFLAWVLLPDRWLLPVVVAGLIGGAVIWWGPGWAPSSEEVAGTPLRVMTWNVRRMWGAPGDEGDAIGCVAAALTDAHPDAVALLEISAENTDRLAAEMGLACVHHPYREGGGTGRGGIAACSAGDRWQLRGGEGMRFVDDEDWFYVFAELAAGDRVFNLLAVHLYPYGFDLARRISAGPPDQGELVALTAKAARIARGQSDQSAALLDRIGKLQDPTVLAGDFNSTRDASLHASLREHLTDTWEKSGFGFGGTVRLFEWFPLRVDHVYASDAFAVAGASVPEVACSDHRPVIADLVLREE